MKITTVLRREFDCREFMGGRVSPQTEWTYGGDVNDTIHRDEVARGVVIRETWYELPDDSDGEYVLTEELETNAYGYYEPGYSGRHSGSDFRLITRAEADEIENSHARGIINQLAVVRVTGDDVVCEYAERALLHRQGT